MISNSAESRGHHLLYEGGSLTIWENGKANVTGGCECGAQPGKFPNVSTKAMQRWHRQHKDDIRRGADTRRADTRREVLAGFLSTLPEYEDRHPETLLLLADELLRVLAEVVDV